MQYGCPLYVVLGSNLNAAAAATGVKSSVDCYRWAPEASFSFELVKRRMAEVALTINSEGRGRMQKDFYLHERGLCAYLEKDWFDHILKSDPYKPKFEFAPFEPSELYSPYHERSTEFLAAALKKAGVEPNSMLEIGSSLGRGFYEICKALKSVKSATLIEPSQNLFSTFHKIFNGETITPLSILKGNLGTAEVVLDTSSIRAACSEVEVSAIQKSFQELGPDFGKFDLVVCSNVIDQCRDHIELAEFVKRSTKPGGALLLSCTYQWSEKWIGNAPIKINDINEVFDSSWKCLGETNIPFQVRVHERHWMRFLSHNVVYQALE
jgi:SAM-dependent methyltransferase